VSELAGELEISAEEAECLKLADSDWEKSMRSLFYRIHLQFGSHNCVSRAISVIEKLASCPEDLQRLSYADQKSIPLAVRYWLEKEGVLVKHARHAEEQSVARPDAPVFSSACFARINPAKFSQIEQHAVIQTVDMAATALNVPAADASELNEAGVDQGADAGDEIMNSETAEAILEKAVMDERRRDSCGQDKPDSVSTDEISRDEVCLETREWVEGQRVEICNPSGELHIGTIFYLSKDGDGICVMDNGSVQKIRTESKETVGCIHGSDSEPKGTDHCLVAVFLKAANGRKGIAESVSKYLQGSQSGSSKIEAVTCASKVLQQQCPDLKFIEVLGEGGYGTVLSVEGPHSSAAVKMEVKKGWLHYSQSPLWREYNLLHAPPKELRGHVPKLCNLFGSHSFARVYNEHYTVSFLSMELLAEYATSILCKKIFLQHGSTIPDSFRHLALCQCLILEKFREAGISHGDVKNAHFMSRPDDAGVVLVDWGLSERSKNFDYTKKSELLSDSLQPTEPNVAKLLYAPAELHNRQGVSASKPKLLRLGRDRPNTPGFRPQNAVCSFEERHQADVWALAVGWLEGVGLVPHMKSSAEQFEKDLYESRQSFEQFTLFIQNFIGKSINEEDFHPSVIVWLNLVYNVLQGGASVLNLLKSNPALTQPFYAPSTLEKLRKTGIIVKGVKSQGSNIKELKPILMMHLEDVGLILLCLLFYLPNETLAYYGGRCVQKHSDETLLYPCHNLPIDQGQEMLGGVTKHFALEDFIDFPAVGSFLKSSRREPYIDEPGSLYKPDRLKNLMVQPGIMSTIGMKTRRVHGPGTQPDWSYNWNAGYGGAIFNETEIHQMQILANKPFPSHVWNAVADARAKVLGEGEFKDADVSALEVMSLRPQGMPENIYKFMCPASTTPAQPHTGGTSQCELRGPTQRSQDTVQAVQPLSPELVRLIEEAAAKCGDEVPGNLRFQEWDLHGARTGATVLDGTEDLKQHGFCVLDEVPRRKTAENQKALRAQGEGGQGILFMDASGLALKSAEGLKNVVGFETVLHARVFARPQQECQSGVTSTTNASNESVTVDPASGGEARDDSDERPDSEERTSESDERPDSEERSQGANQSRFLSAWLLVVSMYISALPDKAWTIIFQKMKGSKQERAGDGLRSESKGFKWVKPEKRVNESTDHFHDRMAGFFALKFFFSDLFDAISKILPYPADISSQLFGEMYSLLSSDGTNGEVEAQSPHNDIKPERLKRRFSALVNLSDLFSYLGILVNSCPNIKAMFDFEEAEFPLFQQRFLKSKSIAQPGKLLSEVMGTGSTDAKVRFAWRHYFANNPPQQFKIMYPVYAKMPPVMVALFDTDTVHWGPPFPMPGIEYPIRDVKIVHYR
jgi:serine/threonine protein kinase